MEEIRIYPDPILRKKATPIKNINGKVKEIVDRMVEVMYANKGIGLAAPQIGVLKRVIIVNLGDKFESYINPEIEIIGNQTASEDEGCLSIYSVKTEVKRPNKILFKAKNLKNQDVRIEAEGIEARIFLHEGDHLDGILFIDHLKPEDRKNFLSKISRNNIL